MRKFIILGLLLGLTTLVKAASIYYLIVIVISLLFDRNFRGQGLRRTGGYIAVLFVVFLATLAPWQYRNLRVHGYYSLTTTQGYNMCKVYASVLKANLEGKRFKTLRIEFCDEQVEGIKNPFEATKRMQEIGLNYITQHKVEYMKFHIKGIYNLFTDPCVAINRMWYAYGKIFEGYGFTMQQSRKMCPIIRRIAFIENLFLIVGLGLMFLRTEGRRFHRVFLTLTILYFANVIGVFGLVPLSGYPRYRLPMLPLMFSLSALGISATLGFLSVRLKAGMKRIRGK